MVFDLIDSHRDTDLIFEAACISDWLKKMVTRERPVKIQP